MRAWTSSPSPDSREENSPVAGLAAQLFAKASSDRLNAQPKADVRRGSWPIADSGRLPALGIQLLSSPSRAVAIEEPNAP
jgi:hypothetical protein